MQLGNKGGCGAGLVWRDTSLGFINCHLAARPERIPQREADYRQIASKLNLYDTQCWRDELYTPHHTHLVMSPPRPPSCSGANTGLDFMHKYEHLFWFGDVNYRVDREFEEAVSMVEAENWKGLLERDQLRLEQAKRRIFVGFQEGDVDFAPTYRVTSLCVCVCV